MSVPYLGSDITISQLEIMWNPLTGTATGGAAIYSYLLEYDQGTNTWTDVQGEDGSYALTLSAIVTGLSGNTNYQFRVSAHNPFGWGLPSSIVTFTTSDVPGAPTNVGTVLHNMNIEIYWTDPSSNYMIIDAYLIQIRDSTGLNYNQEPTYFNGSLTTIVS